MDYPQTLEIRILGRIDGEKWEEKQEIKGFVE